MRIKSTYRYGPYKGLSAYLWWFEVHLVKWAIKLCIKIFFALCRLTLFVPNLAGKAIDKMIWAVAKLFKKEYELNIAEKILGYPYRLYDKIGKWWKNLIYGEPVETKVEEPKPYWILKEPEPHVQKVNYNYATMQIENIIYEPDYRYESNEEEEDIIEEFPFCQIFRLGGDKDLHIMRVEYCPDETAFIRVVSDDSYTKPYKRKVQRDRRGERFILFNNERFYLDPKKTQPRMPE